MNKTLLQYRPSDIDSKEFVKLWENAAYTLQPMYDMLKEMHDKEGNVKETDFECPNHYAKLAFQAGAKAKIAQILSLFPEGCKK